MQKIFLLTVDLEDWFHILNHPYNDVRHWQAFDHLAADATRTLMELFEKHSARATFFSVGWMAEKHPGLIREIQERGHELGVHTYYHMQLHDFSRQAFVEDLSKTTELISHTTGCRPVSFRAPGFSINRHNIHLLTSLKEMGFQNDSSIVPGWHTYGHFPGFPHNTPVNLHCNGDNIIREFPVNTAGIANLRIIFAGGGYFRLLPYWLTHSLMKSRNYNMTYFHPREFQKNHPRVPVTNPLKKWKLYQNLSTAPTKLERMLSEFLFINLRQASNQIDWEKAPTFKIY